MDSAKQRVEAKAFQAPYDELSASKRRSCVKCFRVIENWRFEFQFVAYAEQEKSAKAKSVIL